jgi:hypothetical protein
MLVECTFPERFAESTQRYRNTSEKSKIGEVFLIIGGILVLLAKYK